MNFLGLDIGTTGCKAVLFADDGTLLGKAGREYAVDIPHPGWAEQDAEAVWTLAQDAIHELLESTSSPEVAAIGLSCQGEAVTAVDASGNALRPMILGMDTRTGPQNDWLVERFGSERLFNLTGMPVHTINTLPKLLWLKEHQPDVWRAAAAFRLYEDFLIFKLTGQAAVSRCLASRTQLFDTPRDRWSEEILAALELEPRRLSPVMSSGTPVGALRVELAEALGFRNRPLVVTGGHDQACGALGVGLAEAGLSMVSTGTAEVVEVALPTPTLTEPLRQGNMSVYAHVVAGMYLAMTLNHSGGLSLRWFRDTFCAQEMASAAAGSGDAYDLILQNASAEPTGLLALPHFAGSGTPLFDTGSKGALIGLTFGTTRGEVAKAILEGLTYELRLNLDVLKAGGVRIDQLRAIGGGARSDLWLQLKADITGIPVVAPRITEAAAWGAALLAGAGAGCYADVKAAACGTVKLEKRFQPDPRRVEAYSNRYALYQELYPALRALHHRL